MNEPIEWPLWSIDKIVDSIPDLVSTVEASLDVFQDEYRQKNQSLVELLIEQPLTVDEVRNGSRASDLIALGFALDFLGQQAIDSGSTEEGLQRFQEAHEMFRGGTHPFRPTKPMRQALSNALKALVAEGIEQAQAGQTDAGLVLDGLRGFVISAWGSIPPQLDLHINEMLLTGLEDLRRNREDDRVFHEKFVRDNIESVLSLEIPTRLEGIRDRWEEIGEHIAPAAVRVARRAVRRPEDLSVLLPQEIWNKVETAVAKGDIEALGEALSAAEDDLEANLRLRLDTEVEYRQPSSEIRYRGGPDRYFVRARELLLRRDPGALGEFRSIHHHKPHYVAAKEWYSYALALFGRSTDIHDIVDLLEEAIDSRHFREDLDWTARWNLACALRKLPSRASEALDVLLPVLENDFHPSEAYELCLLWAIEQGRDEILQTLLVKSPYYEAYLLAALYDAQGVVERGDLSTDFSRHFRCINRILRHPDQVFPLPKEPVDERRLDALTQEFLETSLVAAGTEWFRQKLFYEGEQRFYKNWECAARLNEEFGDLSAAWRCIERQWRCTRDNGRLSEDKKASALTSLLRWAQRNGFGRESLRILRQDWRHTSLDEAQVRLWEERLREHSEREREEEREEPVKARRQREPIVEDSLSTPEAPLESLTPTDAEDIIQQVASSFAAVTDVDTLADKADDAKNLLAAVISKHPQLATEAVEPIREIVELATTFYTGVNEVEAQPLAEEAKEQLKLLHSQQNDLPYELLTLTQACERIAQQLATRIRSNPEVSITTPADLRAMLTPPGKGEKYDTRLFARVTNPAPEAVHDLEVAFTSPSQGVRFPEETVAIRAIDSGAKVVVGCDVEVNDALEEKTAVRIHVAYEIGGVRRSCHAMGHIPTGSVGEPIPVTQRYVTGSPVGTDRKDLFHGRDKELSNLAAAFAGGRLRKLYFVNGIRRVGKSSLMEHLGNKCGSTVLPLLLNVETSLGSPRMDAAQFVRRLISESIEQAKSKTQSSLALEPPDVQAFAMDPPWVVFDTFLDNLRGQTGRDNILVCFDEIQELVKRIADPENPMDDVFLTWLRDKVQKQSEILVVCTGSESYSATKNRYNASKLWGNMEPYNVSFVSEPAMRKIATLPVAPDAVVWLPEALERLWDMTEGHPWLTQLLAEKIANRLNTEYRRLVGPQDIDWAADEILASDPRPSELWWNEKDGQVTATHRQIAFLILQNQSESRMGVSESLLAETCHRAGIRTLGKLLEEMRTLEIITEVKEDNEPCWRIRGAFLERYLQRLMQRALQESSAKPPAHRPNQPLALMLDWENIKIGLEKILSSMPEAKAKTMRSRLETDWLGKRLLEAASRHGSPRQRWAVANWDGPFFQGDQKALKRAGRYWTDMAGEDKADASDHVLREKISHVLQEHPEIGVYIIGTGDADFGEKIGTLLEQGKHVVLWSTREAISNTYGYYLTGPDRIQIEWLEDLVFGEESDN